MRDAKKEEATEEKRMSGSFRETRYAKVSFYSRDLLEPLFRLLSRRAERGKLLQIKTFAL